MLRSGILLVTGILLALSTAACGTATQHIAPIENIDERLAATEDGDFSALLAQAEEQWSQREDLSHLDQAIALWEQALHVPTEGDRRAQLFPVLVSLSRAHYFRTDGFTRFEDRPDSSEAMLAGFQQGLEYGHLALTVGNEEFNRALAYETPIPEAVGVTSIHDSPAMYWYSTNMGKWAVLDGIATILAHKDDIAAIMGRVAELDRNYFYGASDRYFGVYWTKIPIGAPNLEQSRRNFESAISINPNYFATRVLFAGEYATKTQERELFEEQLNFVINGDVSAIPEVRQEQEVEQRKAQDLLDNIDEYFR